LYMLIIDGGVADSRDVSVFRHRWGPNPAPGINSLARPPSNWDLEGGHGRPPCLAGGMTEESIGSARLVEIWRSANGWALNAWGIGRKRREGPPTRSRRLGVGAEAAGGAAALSFDGLEWESPQVGSGVAGPGFRGVGCVGQLNFLSFFFHFFFLRTIRLAHELKFSRPMLTHHTFRLGLDIFFLGIGSGKTAIRFRDQVLFLHLVNSSRWLASAR
jgi:hypothetical protein